MVGYLISKVFCLLELVDNGLVANYYSFEPKNHDDRGCDALGESYLGVALDIDIWQNAKLTIQLPRMGDTAAFLGGIDGAQFGAPDPKAFAQKGQVMNLH